MEQKHVQIMSEEHSNIQDMICRMFEWYGFRAKEEYPVTKGYIDCVAFTKDSLEPFVGIEIHISGNLDTDLKKLLDASFLKTKIIVTPDRHLIARMSNEMPTVLWFPVPSQEGHSLENYIRGLPGASKREKYWYEGAADIVLIGKSDGTVEKFENMLRENGLDVNLAEEIIYSYASSPGGIPPDSDGEIETNEYKFLSSLGIVQGLEIYWFDMEWGDMAKYSYERAEVPG